MNDLETITPKARFSTLGLEIADDLTFDEWRLIPPRHGRAAAFCTASIIARSSSPLSRTI